jgi:hypothetical protein
MRNRLLPSLKAKTSSSATSFVSLLPLTVPFAMTRTKPVRTVVKSVTASTIALRSRTLPRASFAVSAVKRVTWLVIALIARSDNRGATTTASAATVLKAVLVVHPRTSWTLSYPRWVAAVAVSHAEPSNTTVVVLAVTATEVANATSSLGSAAQLAAQLPGHVATAVATVATATQPLLRPGLEAVALLQVPVALTTKVAATAIVALLRGPLPHLLQMLRTGMETTELATIRTRQLATALQAMVLLATVLLAMALLRRRLVLLLVWDLFSKTTEVLEALLLLHRRHLALRLPHLPQVTHLLRPHLAMPLRPHPHQRNSCVAARLHTAMPTSLGKPRDLVLHRNDTHRMNHEDQVFLCAGWRQGL